MTDPAVVSDEVLEKAHRLLTDGALTVTLRTPTVARAGDPDPAYDQVEAVCRGDHGEYRMTRRNRVAVCSCPAPRLCAHLVALGLVVDPAPVPVDV